MNFVSICMFSHWKFQLYGERSTDLLGELEMATVFPGASVAGVIAVEM